MHFHNVPVASEGRNGLRAASSFADLNFAGRLLFCSMFSEALARLADVMQQLHHIMAIWGKDTHMLTILEGFRNNTGRSVLC
jgi:hypothetical protein